jgi:hypothetical protein
MVGRKVSMVVIAVGQSREALAVRVVLPQKAYMEGDFAEGFRKPHVTIAVAPGSKPYFSNRIEEWKETDSFTIQGTVREVKR